MRSFFRNVAAVILGWLAGVVIMLVCMAATYAVGHFTAPQEFPFPPDPNAVPSNPIFLAASLLLDFVMAMTMGWVIAWIASKPAHVTIYVAAGLMFVGCIVTLFTSDYGKLPLWVSLARLVIAPVGLLLGAKLRGMGGIAPSSQPYDMREKNMAC